MGECLKCSELEMELEKAALEYLRVTSFGEQNDQPNNAARRKVAEVQKRFNIHNKTHKRMRESATRQQFNHPCRSETPSYSMDNIYKLTRDNVIAECVDTDEKPLDRSERFDSGTVLTIIRGAHLWGNVNRVKYCTVLINGRYFNIPAPVLARSILPKRS